MVDSSRIAEERRNEVLRIQQLKENQREEIKKELVIPWNSNMNYKTVVINDLITGRN